jgi:P27 family predicted phage terminase small subunit
MPKGGSRSGAGRKPKPTAIRLLEGNAGHRPINDAEPQFEAAGSGAPEWLDVAGRELWDQIVPQMLSARVLTVVDVPLLAAACEQWGLYRRASNAYRRSIRQKSGANGFVGRPEVAIAKTALQNCYAILREFGAGASSRSRIKVPGAGEEADPFEEFMKKRSRTQ